MSPRILSLLIAPPMLLTVACGGDTKESSPGEVLARDTALAEDLRIASDTASLSEAADVAMSDEPDTLPRTVPQVTMRASSVPAAPTTTPARPASAIAGLPRVTHREAEAMPPAARIPDLRRPASRPAAPASPRRTAAVAEPCASPATADQRRCLMMHLARSDGGLDRNYQAVIKALERHAGTKPGQPEPESVRRLRAAQRAWLVYRDTECRQRNRGKEGPLWAPVRAQCLGQFSEYRAEELAQTLARLTP